MGNVREGLCFPCYDSQMFQFFGTVNHSQEYIEKYRAGLKESAVVGCVNCDRKVEYIKQESGQWIESVVDPIELKNNEEENE